MIKGMINSIQITNFQVHKNTNLEFDEGLNVITGSSDSGKSSIMRALLWVLKNRPSGDSIRNWDCKKGDKIEVCVHTSDDKHISKQRVDGKGQYICVGNGADEFVYEAFKQDVPEEIERAFNMSEINIQTQHDPYFLLNDSPGEVAKKLNELVGLDVIDKLFKFLNGRITEIKRCTDNETTRSKSLSDEISKLDYLDRLEVEIEELDRAILIQNRLVKTCDAVGNLVSVIVDSTARIDSHKAILSAETQMNTILDEVDLFQGKTDEYNEIDSLMQNITYLNIKIEDEKDWLVVEDYYKDVQEQIQFYRNKNFIYSNIFGIVKSINSLQDQENRLQLNYERLRGQYEELLKKNKLCPLCKTPVDKKMIERMLS